MYTTEKLGGDKFKIKIELSADEWNAYVNEAYEKDKARYKVQGFRPGKAPRRVIEQNYGANVFFETALDEAYAHEYGKVLDAEKEIEPVENPKVDIEKFDETGLTLVLEVQSMPEVKLGAYTGLEIEEAKGSVEDAQVEKELGQMRERNARFVEVQREAKNGDFVTIDFCGKLNGEKFAGGEAKDYRLELGSHSFIPGFEEQIEGMKLGEERTISVTFPEEYHAEDLKGKPATFDIKLNKVEEKQLPELNERLARETENNIIKKITENAEVNVPDCMVERQIDAYMKDMETRLSYQGLKLEDYVKYMNTSIDQIRNDNRKHAAETVKTRLVIEEIIKKEKLSVTEEELEAKLEEVAKKYNKSVEDYKKLVGERQMIYFENEILMDKLIKFLKENNKLI